MRSSFVVLTGHAADAIKERELNLEWVIDTVREPEWSTVDPADRTLLRHFRSIPERGGRILRVACREADDTYVVVTAFFDRRARRPT